MGNQQSSGGNDDCQTCFALPSPFKRNGNSSDPLGSPLPDTPLVRRNKREFSSQYDGLEKELSANSQSSFYISNLYNSRQADVHEGSVCNMILEDGMRFDVNSREKPIGHFSIENFAWYSVSFLVS